MFAQKRNCRWVVVFQDGWGLGGAERVFPSRTLALSEVLILSPAS